ncbi:MAG: ribosome small subunit-dependent GTPase A [Candidatus Eisenbacteria bacterium]|uniref:Small ribosomal subunit biogenesis GTPase RsgA n=1 Tax=Eiseniibacteriota bacterium TaxID=2212470 RepID=A0A849SWI2_UNCEI|nr:ribosome small subunit-dependent GTPase A [Candidatus Eisenbacteria bacterium]
MTEAPHDAGCVGAVVVRVDFGGCVLRTDDGVLHSATVAGRVRGRRKALGNAMVVGDRVSFEPGRSGGDETQAVVVAVAPRRNLFSRRAPGHRAVEQVVAANLDQVLVVASLVDPEFKPGFVDRVLAQCAFAGLPARLVVNKADLGAPAASRALLEDYARAGIEGHVVSVKQRHGLEAVHEVLRGRRSLFVGHSGVGKSSLLNALEPTFELLLGEVNARTGKGRHTTTAALLLRPEPEVELIDTPGVRAFGLWGIDPEQLIDYFPEFAPFRGGCRFADCRHATEPGCTIRASLADGAISRRRYDSFLKLREELRDELGHERPRASR